MNNIPNIKIKENKKNKIFIDGIEIIFPFIPYKSQLKYMEKVIELLNNKLKLKNYNGFAALESPTGTGKTLSLLCSIISWYNKMKKQNKFNGKIIYSTRTHSQISQIIAELKKTSYNLKTSILSSREFSCIFDGLKNKKDMDINKLNIICRNIRRKNCKYKNEFENKNIIDNLPENNIVDIEDLCKEGKISCFCPFYQQINKAKHSADIIFMTYNNR